MGLWKQLKGTEIGTWKLLLFIVLTRGVNGHILWLEYYVDGIPILSVFVSIFNPVFIWYTFVDPWQLFDVLALQLSANRISNCFYVEG